MTLIPYAGKPVRRYRKPLSLRTQAKWHWREGRNTSEIATLLGVDESVIYNMSLSGKPKMQCKRMSP